MRFVTNAAPLIFLAKINQLPLLKLLFKTDCLIPSIVVDEVLCDGTPPDEERLLKTFLSECRIVEVVKPTVFANALSRADNCILTVSVREKVDLVLSDDKLLRKMAVVEGLRVIGTLGVLIQATRSGHLTATNAADLLDALVTEHHFRISTGVYAAARSMIVSSG